MLEEAKLLWHWRLQCLDRRASASRGFAEILSHAKSWDFQPPHLPYGRLLARRAKELQDLDYLSVSVDGIKSYRELRGIDLQDILEGIKAAKVAGHEVLDELRDLSQEYGRAGGSGPSGGVSRRHDLF